MDAKVAPWSTDEVASLNEYQLSGAFHPFTCGPCRDTLDVREDDGSWNDRLLVATTAGWVCPTCDYTQDWAHTFMADGSWEKHQYSSIRTVWQSYQ